MVEAARVVEAAVQQINPIGLKIRRVQIFMRC